MRSCHFGAVAGLQAACFPPPFPGDLLWTPNHLASHGDQFAAGQLVALVDDEVVGSASSLVLDEEDWHKHGSWEETCGGMGFLNHSPTGTTLYGADISVHPDWRGQGVARRLYRERFRIVERLGLKRFGTACRLPGWRSWSQESGLQDQARYCELVRTATLTDPTLTPLLKLGLRFLAMTDGHMDDPESGDSAAVLEWTP